VILSSNGIYTAGAEEPNWCFQIGLLFSVLGVSFPKKRSHLTSLKFDIYFIRMYVNIMDKFFPNRLKRKRSANMNDEGNSCTEGSITENKTRIICIDGAKTEDKLRQKRKTDYPPVTEVMVKKLKTLHTTRKKRKRNGEVYRQNRQQKKKHETIVMD
jgi:hypothetical protein